MNDDELKAIIDNDTAWADHVASMPDDALVPYVREWLADWYAIQLSDQLDQMMNKLQAILNSPLNKHFSREERIKNYLFAVSKMKVRLQ